MEGSLETVHSTHVESRIEGFRGFPRRFNSTSFLDNEKNELKNGSCSCPTVLGGKGGRGGLNLPTHSKAEEAFKQLPNQAVFGDQMAVSMRRGLRDHFGKLHTRDSSSLASFGNLLSA